MQTIRFSDVLRFYDPALRQGPDAEAQVFGSEAYPAIRGKVLFYQTVAGVLVAIEVSGLPTGKGPCDAPVFAVHIHSGGECRGDREDPFKDALNHYNPNGCPHPAHAGDLLSLFGSRGTALTVFLTDRFSVEDVIGRTVILHRNPDDFTTQPAGNAGAKIACGRIERVRRL